MKYTYYMYKGYSGDKFYLNTDTLIELVPDSKAKIVKRLNWLSQIGFGYGYFNNSGKYVTFVKVSTKGEPDLTKLQSDSSITIFDNVDEFKLEVKDYTIYAKNKNKQNPY